LFKKACENKCKIQYLLKQKKAVRIGYNRFLIPHEYSGDAEVRNLYNNDVIIYKIKQKVVRTVLLVNEFS